MSAGDGTNMAATNLTDKNAQSLGGGGLPSSAAQSVQDAMAQKLQAQSGWGQWPATSRMCGVR